MIDLKEKLLTKGCSIMFTEEALEFSSLYKNNLEEFIEYVEDQLNSRIDKSMSINIESYGIEDCGIGQSEMQYNGDLFTMYGYELNFNNSRY